MGVYDNDIILDWTPREYLAKLKGAQHARIDEFEALAVAAVMNARANNEKRVSVKKLFNAEKMHRELDGRKNEEARKAIELNRAFRGFKPDFKPKPKGGR